MKTKIMLLSCLHYVRDGQEHSRLSFIFTEEKYFQNKDNCKGFTEVAEFYDTNILPLLPVDIYGKEVDATIESTQSVKNPLKTYQKVSSIIVNGKTINLLQH